MQASIDKNKDRLSLAHVMRTIMISMIMLIIVISLWLFVYGGGVNDV